MTPFLTRSLFGTLLGFALLAPAAAQVRHIQLDGEPSVLLVDKQHGKIHLLTAGADRNFDGIYQPDQGESLPKWYVIDPTTEQVVASHTFEGFFNSFPLRVGLDLRHGLLYVPQLHRIRAFNLSDQTLARDTVVEGDYAMASFDTLSGMLLLARRPSFSDPGTISVVDPEHGDLMAMLETGPNPSMSIARANDTVKGSDYYTISEGAPRGQIAYSSLQPDIFTTVNGVPLGGGSNQIVMQGNRAYVVLNGTHQVRIIDAVTHRDVAPSPIAVGTSGFDGPRAIAFQGDSLGLVGTYQGDLRRFDLRTGVLRDSIMTSGKIEAVAVSGTTAFAALKYIGGTYTPDSVVAVIDLKSGRVIDSIRVGPGPGALFIDRRGDLHALGYGDSQSVGWWMVFDGRTLARKSSRALLGGLGFPLHVAYDPGSGSAGDSVVIAKSDSVLMFSAENPAAEPRFLYADSTAAGDITATGLAGDYVTATEVPKNFSADPGFVHVIRRSDGHRVAKFRAGSFLDMVVPIPSGRPGVTALYALNDGSFGAPSSTISRFAFTSDILAGDTLGSAPNHLVDAGQEMIVTVNGSNALAEIGFDDWRVHRRIDVGTTGFDGPRETLILPDGSLAVTTYNGDLRIIHGNAVTRVIKTGDRSEGVALYDQKIFVANSLHADYSADSTVAVIDLSLASVRSEGTVASGTSLDQNIPNPAPALTRIGFSIASSSDVRLSLFAVNGERVADLIDRRMEAGSYSVQVPTSGLPAGSYLYVLRSGEMVLSKTMQVVR